jgi:hypothetical protein
LTKTPKKAKTAYFFLAYSPRTSRRATSSASRVRLRVCAPAARCRALRSTNRIGIGPRDRPVASPTRQTSPASSGASAETRFAQARARRDSRSASRPQPRSLSAAFAFSEKTHSRHGRVHLRDRRDRVWN